MPRKDFTQVAFDVVQRAIGAVTDALIDPKKKAAADAGRKGGLKGGKARAKALPAKRRKQIAKRAAKARWS